MVSVGSLEPGDGELPANQPVIGWRVWVVVNNRLSSIAKNATWEPGENTAECFSGHERDIPVRGCHCGFWALHWPFDVMRLAMQIEDGARVGSAFRVLDADRIVVVGLIEGYGRVAMHGWQGFRAELARVICLFSDAPQPLTRVNDARRAVAEGYGVPCVPLQAAISMGVLNEFGVGRASVEQLAEWIASGRPPTLPSLEQHVMVLWAQGLSDEEIARQLQLHVDGPYSVQSILRRALRNVRPNENPPGPPGAPKPRAA